MDLMHGQLLVGNVKVRAGRYEDLKSTQVVVVTAGVGQNSPNESRLELLNRNASVYKNIISELDRYAPDAILIIATNPVDILTFISQQLSKRDPHRIIGTGTLLDTARFRSLLGGYYDLDPQSVHAYILVNMKTLKCQSGVRQILVESLLCIILLWGKNDREALDQLFLRAKNAAYEIIERKGFTNSAIGVVIARIQK